MLNKLKINLESIDNSFMIVEVFMNVTD